MITKIFLALTLMMLQTIPSFAAMGCSHNCNECHSITGAEVKKLITAQQGDVKIISVKMAPVKGLWEVVAEKDKTKGVIYIDFEKTHILYGAIVTANAADNLTQRAFERATKVKLSDINLKETLLLGNKEAKKKMLIFADPSCEHCAELHKIAKSLTTKRSDIAFRIVIYPLRKITPGSYELAKNVYCAKSVSALEKAYQGETVKEQRCDTSTLDANVSVGERYGISGTPTLVFPDGEISFGVRSENELEVMIDEKIKS